LAAARAEFVIGYQVGRSHRRMNRTGLDVFAAVIVPDD
jgi:hypothetical protein